MKAALNGVPNLSVLDGWWPEACQHGVNGRAIDGGDGPSAEQDRRDRTALYDIIEHEVLPAYADRERWVGMMQASIQTVQERFSSERMVQEYCGRLYAREWAGSLRGCSLTPTRNAACGGSARASGSIDGIAPSGAISSSQATMPPNRGASRGSIARAQEDTMTFQGPAVAALLVLSCAGAALADHSEPAKGKKATFALVNAYIRCFTPNTNTSASLSACTPAAPQDACKLSPTGSGKFIVQVIGSLAEGTQDIKLVAVANGLDPFCEGAQLGMTLSFSVTSDDCPEGSCTTYDYDDFELSTALNAFCFVTNGKCKIETTLSATYPGLLPNGKNSGIKLRGCGLKRSGGTPEPEMECGIVLK